MKIKVTLVVFSIVLFSMGLLQGCGNESSAKISVNLNLGALNVFVKTQTFEVGGERLYDLSKQGVLIELTLLEDEGSPILKSIYDFGKPDNQIIDTYSFEVEPGKNRSLSGVIFLNEGEGVRLFETKQPTVFDIASGEEKQLTLTLIERPAKAALELDTSAQTEEIKAAYPVETEKGVIFQSLTDKQGWLKLEDIPADLSFWFLFEAADGSKRLYKPSAPCKSSDSFTKCQ